MNPLIPILLLMFTSSASATSRDACPVLPPGSGLTWSQTEGPDFDVCYATDKSRRQLFGVYLGMAASFDGNRPVVAKGRVGGFKADWVVAKNAKGPSISREALVQVKSRAGVKYQAHVWINAADEAELVRAQAILSAMRFRD
jgi:hypothetical protein